MSNPNHIRGEDWKKYQKFSEQVERKIKGSKDIYRARAKLWVAKITREYLGATS